MNAELPLDDLAGLGIHLVRDGDAILADVADGADITPHRECIKAYKPALLVALHLRERIVAAASVERSLFDRSQYDRLWAEWHTQEDAS